MVETIQTWSADLTASSAPAYRAPLPARRTAPPGTRLSPGVAWDLRSQERMCG